MTYRITSITDVAQYEDKAYSYWRKADIENTKDKSDKKTINLNLHTETEASAVLMIDNVPHAGYVFRFREEENKPLERWEKGDFIVEI